MEKFNFDYYNDSVKKIKCFYTYGENVGDDTFWEGYIITKNIDGILSIEGYEKDYVDSLESTGKPHLRYILGNKAISYADSSLKFEIYPGNIAPIHYDMVYNKEDGCFYGSWNSVPNRRHPFPKGKGEAIISIEDTNIDEKDVKEIIEKLSDKSKKEYSDLMEVFEIITHCQSSLFESEEKVAIKKLSKLSNVIR